MALVLAIEPDLRQANIVKRIVREKVLADVAVVDSRDAALEAMRTTMPDVLLLSALLSPRDEDELIAHLRTLDNADHLQTHTIPQLASAHEPSGGRAAGGLLSAFRRKKKAPEDQPSGCDPDIFAEEIRSYLQRAAEKKRERLESQTNATTPPDNAWRTSIHAEKAPEPTAAKVSPEEAASSSWSSPFEWKPSNPSSLISNPYSRVMSPEDAAEMPEAMPQAAGPLIPASVAAESFSPEGASYEGSMSLDTAAVVDTTVHGDAFAYAAAPGEIFAHLEAPTHADAPIAADVFARVDAPIHVDTSVFALADAPTHADTPRLASASTYVDSIHVDAPVHVQAPLYGEAETPVYVDAPIHVEAPASMRESGPRDRRPRNKDKRLGFLASWMRSERTPPAGSGSADDLRGLLGSLAIPTGVAAVAYPRGVRIRRVRVPAAREPRVTEPAGAVILSKRLLAEERERRANA